MVISSCEDVRQSIPFVEHIMHGFILLCLWQEAAVGGHAAKLFLYDPHDGQCVLLPPFVVVTFRPAFFSYLVLVVLYSRARSLLKRGSSGSTSSSTTSTSKCYLRFAPLLVRARSFFSEGRSAVVSRDAGVGVCFSDLFSVILASPLIMRFCLAFSSDLCSSRFLKDATSSRRTSALRLDAASWFCREQICSCKNEFCCCNNAIISSLFILQRYKKKTRLPNNTSCILIKILLIINRLQTHKCQCSTSCDILPTSTIFRSL